MRVNRIGTALFVSAISLAAPALAQTPYDGLWNVTVVTKSGSCEPETRSTLTITDGKIFAPGSEVSGSVSYAQSGPFAGMAGVWAGGGTVTLEDGSSERIRCRATYAVGAGGAGLNMNLLCASDSYRFDLTGNLISDRGVLSGTWGE